MLLAVSPVCKAACLGTADILFPGRGIDFAFPHQVIQVIQVIPSLGNTPWKYFDMCRSGAGSGEQWRAPVHSQHELFQLQKTDKN